VQVALARERKPDDEEHPAREPVLGENLPVVGFDDGAGNRKSHPHALRLGGEKRIEDVLEVAGPLYRASIANPDFRAGARKVRGYADFALLCLRFGYRTHRVDNQIQNDLLQLDSIALHLQVGWGLAALKCDIAPVVHGRDKSDHLPYGFVQVDISHFKRGFLLARCVAGVSLRWRADHHA